ncbi:MAG: acyl-homoserine-lactone synthase [Hyphomicrobiaceae bacterium]
MIVVIEPGEREAFRDELEASYRLRHRIFVEERGWTSFAKPGDRECDHLDEVSTTFLAIQHDEVIGCARLVPGAGLNPDIVTDQKVQALAGRTSFAGLGRFCVATEIRGGSKVRNPGSHLLVAVLEHARDARIGEIFFETDPWFVALLRLMKVRLETIGPPMPYYGREMVMAIVPVDQRAIDMCRRMLKLELPGFGSRPDAQTGR